MDVEMGMAQAMGRATDDDSAVAIAAQDLGIRFRRNRIRHRRLSDLVRQQKGRARSEFWAIRNVTFSIPQGESVGIVGANGQGKSTLLKLVAGTLIPDEGSVSLHGGVAPLVNISGGFKNDLTVRDNLHIVGLTCCGCLLASCPSSGPPMCSVIRDAYWATTPNWSPPQACRVRSGCCGR